MRSSVGDGVEVEMGGEENFRGRVSMEGEGFSWNGKEIVGEGQGNCRGFSWKEGNCRGREEGGTTAAAGKTREGGGGAALGGKWERRRSVVKEEDEGGVYVCMTVEEIQAPAEPKYDRKSELQAFDDTKAGVKGLVDAGVTKLPRIFIHPPENLRDIKNPAKTHFDFPLIDLDGVDEDAGIRQEIVDRVREASETWGFFQIVNHGVPVSMLEEMLDRVRRFNEQKPEIKKQFYTRDFGKKMGFIATLICLVLRRLTGGTQFTVLLLLMQRSRRSCRQCAGVFITVFITYPYRVRSQSISSVANIS
ncbi:UNVERIFIED_CONTAM: 1-aminocyclopropane-1-carboxylate oxidase [Sesamum latifolium]|uniref:1-aminocyclopropane-1-carboxylate oxidase n=1 Tax=Sesamum latifolium TaxID=2727402 RepID=A0AAW2VWT9_9LAMI